MKRIAIAAVMSLALAAGVRAQDRQQATETAKTYLVMNMAAKECGYKPDPKKVREFLRRGRADFSDPYLGAAPGELAQHIAMAEELLKLDRKLFCDSAWARFGPKIIGSDKWEPLYAVE